MLSLDPEIVELIDKYVKEGDYLNRTDAIRYCIRVILELEHNQFSEKGIQKKYKDWFDEAKKEFGADEWPKNSDEMHRPLNAYHALSTYPTEEEWKNFADDVFNWFKKWFGSNEEVEKK